eukprot:TRINITY_DN7842_c0_g1_i2.p1 TRINITY_DN7842_c0_g1~~TRINITY_DN7842_c0_g1_i2.p1  ORF type:complete len:130 (-),score=32.81 TRINITY_DN7842_c0_g1_i2:318-707(-)
MDGKIKKDWAKLLRPGAVQKVLKTGEAVSSSDEKAVLRRERNRISAQVSREREKAFLQSLRVQDIEIRTEIEALTQQLQIVQEERAVLRQKLSDWNEALRVQRDMWAMQRGESLPSRGGMETNCIHDRS